MPLLEAMMTQRAVRRVLPDPVDPAIIRRLVELSLRAPTGSNGQNWEFVAVTDPETKAVLAKRYRQAFRPYHAIGSRLTKSDPSMQKILRAVKWQVDNFEQIPVIVIPCLKGGKPPFVPTPPFVQTSFYGSIYPSVQNLLLGARAMGLGASLITLPLWSTMSVRRLLNLPMAVHPVCLIPMGWPQGQYGPTTRRSVDEVLHWERFDN